VAQAGNVSYSGDRDQEDRGLKPAQTNSGKTHLGKNPSQKRAGGVAEGVGPEFKPQCQTKEKTEAELNSDCGT
jgi:hypothetical protein